MEVNNKMLNRDGKGLQVKKGGSFRTKNDGQSLLLADERHIFEQCFRVVLVIFLGDLALSGATSDYCSEYPAYPGVTVGFI